MGFPLEKKIVFKDMEQEIDINRYTKINIMDQKLDIEIQN